MALYDNRDFYYSMGKNKEQDNKICAYLSKSARFNSDEDSYISSIANELIDIVGPEQAAAFVDRYLFTQDSDECMKWLFKKLEPYAKHTNDNSVQEFIKEHMTDIKPGNDYGPTGIANPADYMSSVTETEEDTNGDGNIDKVTIEKETN